MDIITNDFVQNRRIQQYKGANPADPINQPTTKHKTRDTVRASSRENWQIHLTDTS